MFLLNSNFPKNLPQVLKQVIVMVALRNNYFQNHFILYERSQCQIFTGLNQVFS